MRTYLLIIVTLIVVSCSDDDAFTIVFGPQPRFIDEHDYSDVFNVFGVLRPDSIEGQPMSFVLVEKTMPAVNSEPDSFHVYDAKVMLYALDNGVEVDSFELFLDTLRAWSSTYRASDFEPEVGREYRLVCSKEGFPTLTAYATVPNTPSIVDDEVVVMGNRVSFTIAHDSLTAMYDIILIAGEQFQSLRLMQPERGETNVSIPLSGDLPSSSILLLYSYDENMASYLTEASVFIKPNTYRPPFSNVTGGYGSLGGVNMLSRPL